MAVSKHKMTMTQAKETPTSGTEDSGLTEQQVSLFLEQNPDFFNHNPALLEFLLIPHEKGTAISLIERQIEILRNKNSVLEEQQQILNDIALQNDKIQERLHGLVVQILTASNINNALGGLSDSLASSFDLRHVEIRLFADSSHPLSNIDKSYVLTSDSAEITLDEFTPTAEPLCGHLKPAQLKRIHGELAAGQIGSSVIIPLRQGELHGLIAMGSVDEHRFSPAMDTLYLRRLGEQISAALVCLLNTYA